MGSRSLHEKGQFSGHTVVSYAEMAELIDLLFRLWTRVGWRKHEFNILYSAVVTSVHNFNRIRQVAPIWSHGKAHWHHLANTIESSIFGSELDRVQIPAWEGQFSGKGSPIVKYRDILHELCRNGWTDRFVVWVVDSVDWRHEFNRIQQLAPVCPISIVFARWRQFGYMERHIGTTWRIRLNPPSAAAMRSYVKWFWPLVCIVVRQLTSIKRT